MDNAAHETVTQVVIALRHRAARAAVRSVLETSPSLDVAAAVGDLDAALAAVLRSGARVLVLDAALAGKGSGLLARGLGVAVILVGIDEERGFARAALEAGAAAYLVSDATPDVYLETVEATARAA